MTEQFLAILESHLGIQHTKISLAEQWKDSPPPEAEGKSIEDYLVMVCALVHSLKLPICLQLSGMVLAWVLRPLS